MVLDLFDFMESMPKVSVEEESQEQVEFKWDNYHKAAIREVVNEDFDEDDDWDEEDDEGVEIIYQP